MSIPYLLDESPFVRFPNLFNQHFGVALTPDDILTPFPRAIKHGVYYRPWRNHRAEDLGSILKADAENFKYELHLQHFAPEEISVKTVDGYIVVEGKHEEKQDEHGFVSRQFVRKYALPAGTLPENVESTISSDGVLTITVPRKVPESIKGERIVPIKQTGPVRKHIKDQNEGTHEKPE